MKDSIPVELPVSQPSEPSCENCKQEEFSDKVGSYCQRHKRYINELFPDDNLTLSELGCRQFEQK